MQNKVKPTDITRYIKILRVLQTFVWVLPIGFSLCSNRHWISPPLGPDDNFVLPIACVLVGIFTLVPLALPSINWATVVFFVSVLGSICLLFTYASFVEEYVAKIDITAQHRTIYVSIGSQRTAFAITHYPNWSSEDMLIDQGHEESDIQRMWTRESISSARSKLLCFYILLLVCLNLSIGSLARKLSLAESNNVRLKVRSSG